MLRQAEGKPEALGQGAAWRVCGGVVVLVPHRVRKGSGAHEVTATRMTRRAVSMGPEAAWEVQWRAGDNVVVVVVDKLRKGGGAPGIRAARVAQRAVCMGPRVACRVRGVEGQGGQASEDKKETSPIVPAAVPR